MVPRIRIRIHTNMAWIRKTGKNSGRPRPSHGVDNRLRLLKDLLVHEAGEVALHDLLDLQHDGRDLPALGRLQVNAPADPAATPPYVIKNLGFQRKFKGYWREIFWS
jgi:hypothetical protein